MKLHLFACLCLLGCGESYGSLSNPPPNDLGPGPQDASVEVGVHNPDSGLCCQITNNFTNDPYWHSGRYDCLPPDAALQPFDPPWVCQVNEAGMCGGNTGLTCLSCDQPACVVGLSCLGVNGTGIVLPCDQQDW